MATTNEQRRFTVENVIFLSDLIASLTVDAANPRTLVNAMRELVEVVVWGDKFNETIFDLFMEKNTMSVFTEAVENPAAQVEVKVQCFQCFTILLGNLRRKESVYYVMSKNHINRIISSDLDFSNDEIVSNYISFVKALSLKLNSELVQFFFQQQSGGGCEFPLYECSIRLLGHSDRLVRTSVRQIVVNVLNIEEDNVKSYITGRLPEFVDGLAKFNLTTIAELGTSITRSGTVSPAVVDAVLEDVNDDLFFLNDLHSSIKSPTLQDAVVVALVQRMVGPLRAAARENSDAAALLALANWCRILQITQLAPALVEAGHETAVGILGTTADMGARHPIALAVLANCVELYIRLVEPQPDHAPFPGAFSGLIDTVLFALRVIIWRPRYKTPAVIAFTLTLAHRIATGVAATTTASSSSSAPPHEQYLRSLRATLWWLQQYILLQADKPTAEAVDAAEAKDASPTVEEGLLSATPHRRVAVSGSADALDELSISPQRARAFSELFEADSPAVQGTLESTGGAVRSPVAEQRRKLNANLAVYYESLAAAALSAPVTMSQLKRDADRVGKDVDYLHWGQLPVLRGQALRRSYMLSLVVVRAAVVSALKLCKTPEADVVPATTWVPDTVLLEVANTHRLGTALTVATVRRCDCVRVQVCAVDDLDASTALIEKGASIVHGIPIGIVAHLTILGAQLVLIDFSEDERNEIGQTIVTLPLAFTCSVVESARPFRLRITVDVDDPSLVPIRELGLVSRDRGICHAVVGRLNEIALASRTMCYEALAAFLCDPIDESL